MASVVNVPAISVEEYIERFIEGDEKPACEYIDGEIVPKSMGTKNHSQVQMNVGFLIRSLYGASLNPLPELTSRVRESKFYIPDMAVEELARPIAGRYPGPNDPVFLCVEILSPPDRVVKLWGKCEEYHKWGVPFCWVIDPERKIAWEYFPGDVEPRKLEGECISAGPIQLALKDVFARV
jgi:Uma2 family endonuclease